MRRFVLLLAVLGGLSFPAAAKAQDPCACTRPAAASFINDARAVRHYRRSFTRQMTWVDPAVVRRQRGQIQTGVYDWAAGGYIQKPGFCKRNEKVCRAIRNCIVADAGAWAGAKGGGAKDPAANWAFGTACATAAATTMLNP
jgi:hypothetical protein